jgi:flagellar protein FliL
MKRTIILSIAALLIVAGSIAGTLFALGRLPGVGAAPAPPPDDANVAAPGPAAAPPPATASRPMTYVSLDPAFTMSFQDSEAAQFLQFNIDVAVEEKDAEEAIKVHGPAIRNGLVMLMSGQKAEDLQSREGKERLRTQIRDEIRDTLSHLTGKPGVVEVFFTSFLMQ